MLKLTGGGGAAEFLVGDGRPEEEAHAAGHIPIAERLGGHGFQRLFDAVEECGRNQNAGQEGANGFVVIALGGHGVVVEGPQALLFLFGQGMAPGNGGEAEAIGKMMRAGGGLGGAHGHVLGVQGGDVLAGLGGQGIELRFVEVGHVLHLEIELEMLGQQAQIVVVVGERRAQVGPGVIEADASGFVEHVFDDEAIAADIFHVVDKGVVLRGVVRAVEWVGRRIFVGRSWLDVGIRRKKVGELEDARFEFAIAGACGIADEGAGGDAAGTFFAVADGDAEDLVAIDADGGVHLEVHSNDALGQGDLEVDGAFGGEIIGTDRAAVGAGAEVELFGGFLAHGGA